MINVSSNAEKKFVKINGLYIEFIFQKLKTSRESATTNALSEKNVTLEVCFGYHKNY